MICNKSKWKELIFRKNGFNENMPLVTFHNVKNCRMGVTFQKNCNYSVYVRSKLFKANKCLFILRLLKGLRQEELDFFLIQ